jgi:hypothetical protein
MDVYNHTFDMLHRDNKKQVMNMSGEDPIIRYNTLLYKQKNKKFLNENTALQVNHPRMECGLGIPEPMVAQIGIEAVDLYCKKCPTTFQRRL